MGDKFHTQMIRILLVVEAASIDAAAQSLGVAIKPPDTRGSAEVICREAYFRLEADSIWLAPIFPDQPGILSEALDRLEQAQNPLDGLVRMLGHLTPQKILSRQEWLEVCEWEDNEKLDPYTNYL